MWRPEEGIGPWELESEMFVNHPTWMLESELRSCARAVCFPNHQHVCSPPKCMEANSLKLQVAFQRDFSGLHHFPLLCSVPVLFVIPSRFLVQVD